jgi:hypothetical protein
LAVLAHTRDAILVLRHSITEEGGLTLTGHAQPIFYNLVAILTRERREEGVDHRRFVVCFHGYIIPHWGRIARGKKKKF